MGFTLVFTQLISLEINLHTICLTVHMLQMRACSILWEVSLQKFINKFYECALHETLYVQIRYNNDAEFRVAKSVLM